MTRLDSVTWRQASEGGILVLPVGATEQHGPHLPLGTDTVIIEALVAGLEELRPQAWVCPAVPIGASGEHGGFPGTLSLGNRVLTDALVEIGRSADLFDGLLVVSWHGGNVVAIEEAIRRLRSEGRAADAWLPHPDPRAALGDIHAGRLETSLMLSIDPGSVRSDRFERGHTEVPSTLIPRLRRESVAAISGNGVLGDPQGANAVEGRQIFERQTKSLVETFDVFSRSIAEGPGALAVRA